MLRTVTYTQTFTAGTLRGLTYEATIRNASEYTIDGLRRLAATGKTVKSTSPYTVSDVRTSD